MDSFDVVQNGKGLCVTVNMAMNLRVPLNAEFLK